MKTLNNSEVCILIPAFNESLKINNVLKEINEFDVSTLVVDDGSTDNTVEICKQKQNIILIEHKDNLGYEEALNTGHNYLSKKNFKYIVTLDADDQLSVNDVLRFVKLANEEGLDLVVGHRSHMNRISEFIFSIISRFFLDLKDPFCGLKLYKLNSIKNFLPFDSYNLIGSELLLRSKYNNLKIAHLPIKIKKREGLSRFGNNMYGEYKVIKASFFILINHFFNNKFM